MVKTFGFGVPVKYDGLAKGMLVYAAPSNEQHYLGIIAHIRSEKVLVVIASNVDDAPPNLINASALHGCMWKIDGHVEVEPKSGNFTLPEIDTISRNGLIIDASGELFAVIQSSEIGGYERFNIHLSTGEHADGSNHSEIKNPYAALKNFSVFIRQVGRDARFSLETLTPDR